ncbi:helix-turn-helix transcriptional regulator [Oceanivirga miroungae]|uniref:HTH araC/xylS-type domain-containing protein n=1 Tax=Oceanivirga miroungae TaxID=1130046 RepID=A0A6I8M879_9FUSO|nr:AraC family transcriptional regulator [Oceanivirga miroungae]VWL85002.1 hypothetical protein OMES3154_00274 [Oceanivirga miroungae]
MDYLAILIEVIEYIESDIKRAIDKEYISIRFGVSYETLSRVSSIYMEGITLTKYIKYRRLSEACNELLETNNMISDMAIQYGYQSSNAFSNAFKKYHGNSPLDVRNGASYKKFLFNSTKLYEKLSEKVVITVENIKSYEVSAIKIGNYKDLIEKKVDFSSLWNDFTNDNEKKTMLKDKNVYEIIDIDNKKEAIYYIAFEKLDKNLEKSLNMKPLKIKSSKYTVLSTKVAARSNLMPKILDYVVSKFLSEDNRKNPSQNRFLCAKSPAWGSVDFDLKYYIDME